METQKTTGSMDSSRQYYAHTDPENPGKTPEEGAKWQLLEDHLRGTAELARKFASAFNAGDWGYVVGLLHDLGKYHPGFQSYLKAQNGMDSSDCDDNPASGRPNHSGMGAILSYKKWSNVLGKTLAYIVSGHHAGLPDWLGGADSLSYRTENEKKDADIVTNMNLAILDELPEIITLPTIAMQCKNGNAISYHLWVRMLYSCLVDADFLDTEAFMDKVRHENRKEYPQLTELKRDFDARLNEMTRDAKSTIVNQIRADILSACRKAADSDPGLFRLTVPTGGGKTLSGTAFALDHAVKYNKNRIIYVIPYTSIIEQTANVLRNFFGNSNVIEHHSNISQENELPSHALAAENWDAPVIVTTSVQFFESLLAAKSSRCRKLHNIVNSVIIIDEAQLLPPQWLYPCTEMINRLVSDYSTSIVLSTATQPALPYLTANCSDIIPEPKKIYDKLKRTDIILPENINQPQQWSEIADELKQHKQILCVVNRRKDCFDLWNLMPQDTIHLSALMCGEHRSKTINIIKQKLCSSESCRVISTQLVEAGVDLDFPVVYRAIAGLDSITQAAGRCNREGKLVKGVVKVFVAPKPSPAGLLRKGEDTTKELAALGEIAFEKPETYDKYFELFYSKGNDHGNKWLHDLLIRDVNPEGNAQFRTAGKEFHLIEDTSTAIIVNYGKSNQLIEKLKQYGPNREIMRKLQRFTVNIPKNTGLKLLQEERIEIIYEDIHIQTDSLLYDGKVGLNIFKESYEADNLVI